MDLVAIANGLRMLEVDGTTCKSLSDARALAQTIIADRGKPIQRMALSFAVLGIPTETHQIILEKWSVAGFPPLVEYAPFAAHVLAVEIFFHVALAAHLISSERLSNRVDVAYLYYLPFCMIFVSSDRLHQRCAQHFLREDQEFIWGTDLKSELQRIDRHFANLPDETKALGLYAFARMPPGDDDALIVRLCGIGMLPAGVCGRRRTWWPLLPKILRLFGN